MAALVSGSVESGTRYIIGRCEAGEWKGFDYVSLGTPEDHTTFILAAGEATPELVTELGDDKNRWKTVALVMTWGYWDD